MSRGVKTFFFLVAVVALVGIACWAWLFRGRNADPASVAQSLVPAVTNSVSAASITNATNAPKAMVEGFSNYPDFKMRPLPVGAESANNQWTLADGKDTNVIRQLAHNPLEYARMVDENARIFQRQLVYLKKSAASVFEQAKLTGSTVTQLTLPGLDGRELDFEIVKRDGADSSRQGRFSGHLDGNPNSLVTLAFEDGREAFTILSPNDKVFVVAEPRENGQVIVKAIDPNTYGVGPAPGDADDAVKTAPAKK